MEIDIRQAGVDELPRYARVPIRFWVHSVLHVEVVDGGLGGLRLVEEIVAPPYLKDYDAQSGGEEGPTHWSAQFDVCRWGFFLAEEGERPVGAAAVAFGSPGVHMLEDRPDLAVLWDIRVHPSRRGRAVGTQLFRIAAAWAGEQGARQLKVETQNVNVPACRFYAAQGCRLGAIHRYGYAGCPEVAHEAMLLWYLDL
ncbi:MAG TPA: GNAT family N-acetyltransferase [Anaerolineae bacterium]|nr:GNAT family N-acetyltransferase [Anaerolineae bacterium]